MTDETTPLFTPEAETETVRDGAAPARTQRPGPRGGTITWGIILIAIAALAVFGASLDLTQLTGATVLWGVVGLGALIIVAAIVAAIIRAVSKRTD